MSPAFPSRVAALLLSLLFVGCATAPPTHRLHAVRLMPGADLRGALEQWSRERGLRAGAIVTCAGSVKRAGLRFADQMDATVLEGPFEIVSLAGTLAPDGAHLHMSVADASGRTVGGHLTEGTIVYTTAEIVIAELHDVNFTREIDSQTTFRELVIREAAIER